MPTNDIQKIFIVATAVTFISFIILVYTAIWFQSIIFGEMAIASLAFTIMFGWLVTLSEEKSSK
jgi:hypothetical protein